MRIAILSDTHGSLDAFNKVLEIAKPYDYIIHAGDILYHGPRNPLPAAYNPSELAKAMNKIDVPFIAAAGNCDAPIDQVVLSVPIQSPYALLIIDGCKILITHGHQSTEEELVSLAKKWKIDILITGHTHVKVLEKKEGLILLNPGSCALPKDGIPSFAIFEKSNLSLINIETGDFVKSIAL
ncbi:phosphodiesterase [Tepidanaerobacter syntrophicus]|uniref:phosphodiesterase n=1 Tax=Tepidanaerobacter syntrophicus TaxID=224999 RepID=UPI001BD4F3BB